MDFKSKYLKYKTKYLKLKDSFLMDGGSLESGNPDILLKLMRDLAGGKPVDSETETQFRVPASVDKKDTTKFAIDIPNLKLDVQNKKMTEYSGEYSKDFNIF